MSDVDGRSYRGEQLLRGTIAAAFTPLSNDGDSVDIDAIGPYTEFLISGGVDGILALGSAGEGILLSVAERKLVAERYREVVLRGSSLAIHVGALTTSETIELAEHAVVIGADAVVAVAPPYYGYSTDCLAEHFAAAASACFPTPFYIYEFAARSGYAIPASLIAELRDRLPNLRGIKVTDTPFSAFEQYLIDGLDVFVGFEPLIPAGIAAGAVGAVSGIAAFDPTFTCELVRTLSAEKAEVAGARIAAYGSEFIARGKSELAARGLIQSDVRKPLLPVQTIASISEDEGVTL